MLDLDVLRARGAGLEFRARELRYERVHHDEWLKQFIDVRRMPSTRAICAHKYVVGKSEFDDGHRWCAECGALDRGDRCLKPATLVALAFTENMDRR